MEEESSDSGGDATREAKATTYKGRSCKGCLYYSSLLKSESRRPLCFGISRTRPQVRTYVVGESEMQAVKDGHILSDFKYACVGYSVFLDDKDSPSEKRENHAELPSCVGIKAIYFWTGSNKLFRPYLDVRISYPRITYSVLVDRRPSTATHAPSYANREDTGARSQPRGYKPGHSSIEEFLSRLSRNAGLVASSAARNLQKAGNYVKENIDDILYPYRRRPK